MASVVMVVLDGAFPSLHHWTVWDNCVFCKCSRRGARPLPRLAPVPRPHVISGNRNRLQPLTTIQSKKMVLKTKSQAPFVIVSFTPVVGPVRRKRTRTY